MTCQGTLKKTNNARESHHPDLPGFWLHPLKGTYHLRADEEHAVFFREHPSLFGTDLSGAYADDWVSIRRWEGDPGVWVVTYGQIEPVRHALGCWARILLSRWQEEAATPVECAALLDPRPLPVMPLGALPAALSPGTSPAQQEWRLTAFR
jgi:hypothetical protein